MEYKIYSSEWHGIHLADLAKERGISVSSIADHHVYDSLYERWAADDFNPDAGWLEAKPRIAALIEDAIARSGVNPPADMLSVGVGLALIEIELLHRGWDVTLQECQPHSLSYARRLLGDRMPRVIIDPTIASAPSDSYDVVLAAGVCYAFDKPTYRSFLADVARVLRPGGLFVIWEHDARFWPLSYTKIAINTLRGRKYLPWGWVRGFRDHERYAGEAGLALVESRFFDFDLRSIPNPPRIAGCQLPFGPSLAQLLTFRLG
jgi:SAM-dependent methyltransferase